MTSNHKKKTFFNQAFPRPHSCNKFDSSGPAADNLEMPPRRVVINVDANTRFSRALAGSEEGRIRSRCRPSPHVLSLPLSWIPYSGRTSFFGSFLCHGDSSSCYRQWDCTFREAWVGSRNILFRVKVWDYKLRNIGRLVRCGKEIDWSESYILDFVLRNARLLQQLGQACKELPYIVTLTWLKEFFNHGWLSPVHRNTEDCLPVLHPCYR